MYNIINLNKNINLSFFSFSCSFSYNFSSFFNNTDCDCLFHISDCESSQWRIFGEDFNTHRFGRYHFNHAGLSWFNEFWEFFQNLTSSSINWRLDFFEFNCDMCSMAIQYWAISVLDLSWVVQDNNLSEEVFDFTCWVILWIRANISSSNVFNGNVFNIESHVVPWNGFS